jgi:hypothetical protein
MENRSYSSSPATGRRSSGPQGTRLFSADELSRLAGEAGFANDGGVSVHKPVLEGTSAALKGRRFTLRAGRQTVGRGGENDIVICDPSVSSTHAWVMNQQGHCVVMNTLSTNGTFVNNKRVHEATIRHGDRVRFGQSEFVFLTREPGASRLGRVGWFALAMVLLMALGGVAWWWLSA